jgi:hypothetical protein
MLYGVVRNVARRYEERVARHGCHTNGKSVYLDELPAQAQTMSRMFDGLWAKSLMRDALLRHALAARAGDCRARRRWRILRMRHASDMPIRKIADAIGEPDVDKVHSEYGRARREFGITLREMVAAGTGKEGAAVEAECRRLIELLGT